MIFEPYSTFNLSPSVLLSYSQYTLTILTLNTMPTNFPYEFKNGVQVKIKLKEVSKQQQKEAGVNKRRVMKRKLIGKQIQESKNKIQRLQGEFQESQNRIQRLKDEIKNNEKLMKELQESQTRSLYMIGGVTIVLIIYCLVKLL